MNLFLVPMWLLSGALFPASGVALAPLRWVIQLNPLSYGVSGLRCGMEWGRAGLPHPAAHVALYLGISLGFAAVMFLLASRMAMGRVAADLQ
jgi:ABC-2 type transport system permease protein